MRRRISIEIALKTRLTNLSEKFAKTKARYSIWLAHDLLLAIQYSLGASGFFALTLVDLTLSVFLSDLLIPAQPAFKRLPRQKQLGCFINVPRQVKMSTTHLDRLSSIFVHSLPKV